jgi:hypothetical protein
MAVNGLKLSNAGFRKLRTSPKMDALVLAAAKKAAAAAGPNFEATLSSSKNRARATVHPKNAEGNAVLAADPSILIGAIEAARR